MCNNCENTTYRHEKPCVLIIKHKLRTGIKRNYYFCKYIYTLKHFAVNMKRGIEPLLRIMLVIALVLLAGIDGASAKSRRALLIGVSEYPRYKQQQLNWRNIHGANDVALIGNTLRRQGFSVTALTNRHATASAIRKALRQLEKQTTSGDLIYIHFSAHGQPFEDLNGDEDDGWDEAIVPYDAGKTYMAKAYEGKNHITDDELNARVTAIRKKAGARGFVYVVIDACHAGGSIRNDKDEDSVYVRGTRDGFSRSGKPFTPKADTRPMISVPGVAGAAPTCYIEACRSNQSNTELKEGKLYYGSLSYYINKVLASTSLSSDTSWTNAVRRYMGKDKRLIFQDMVIEKSGR